MASAGSIFIDLLLRDSAYKSGLDRASAATRNATNSWQRDLGKSKQAFASVLNPVNSLTAAFTRMAGAFAGALSVQKLVQYSDTWRGLESRLLLVAGNMDQVATVQQKLYDIAQKTGQPLQASIEAYTRLSNSLNPVQKQQTDMVRVSELLSKTLLISGANAAGAATFFQQFGQAASSDFKAIGQELQTFADQNPRFYKILQDEANRYGKTLKEMAKDGDLSFQLIADAVVKSGDKIDGEVDGIALTVGRALTQLDNAFLRFIGTSQAVSGATSGLAVVIKSAADNFSLLADAAVVLGTVYAARLITSLTASVALWAANTSQVILYQAALARMAGVSTVAAAGITALGAAATIASRAMALLGGPIGIALIGTYLALSERTQQVADAQAQYNKETSDFLSHAGVYMNASEQVKNKIVADTKARINAYVQELEAMGAVIDAQTSLVDGNLIQRQLGGIRLLGREIGAVFGAGESPSAVFAKADALRANINKLRSGLNTNFQTGISDNYRPISDGKTDKEAIKRQKEINSLYENYEGLILGVSDETIKYQKTVADLNELKKAGLIDDQQIVETLERLRESFKKNSEDANQWGIDLDAISKRAAENMQDAFADFLFDPFQSGLDGMLKGFVDMLRKMAAEAMSKQIFEGLFGQGGMSGIGGLFGGLLGSQGSIARAFTLGAGVQGPLPMFADGGYLEPGKWGVAGEAGAEMIYGGKSGMTIVPQDGARNNSYVFNVGGDVSQAQFNRLQQMVLTTAGPGVTERRIMEAQVRGQV